MEAVSGPDTPEPVAEIEEAELVSAAPEPVFVPAPARPAG